MWATIHQLIHTKQEEIAELLENIDDALYKIDNFINATISRYGKEIIQFYFHLIDFHYISIIKYGVSLQLVQNQGFEHYHAVHKKNKGIWAQMMLVVIERQVHTKFSFVRIF